MEKESIIIKEIKELKLKKVLKEILEKDWKALKKLAE